MCYSLKTAFCDVITNIDVDVAYLVLELVTEINSYFPMFLFLFHFLIISIYFLFINPHTLPADGNNEPNILIHYPHNIFLNIWKFKLKKEKLFWNETKTVYQEINILIIKQ